MTKKYYFINKLETNNIDKQDKNTIIIYRNYPVKMQDEKLLLRIKKYCKRKRIKFYLSLIAHLQFFLRVFQYRQNV